MSIRLVVFCIALMAALTPQTVAAPLLAGDVLRVDFTTNTIASPCLGQCDGLWMAWVGSGPFGLSGPITLKADLYVGSTLLATQTITNCACGPEFHDPGSLATVGAPMDFTIFQNNAVQGHLDVSWTGPGNFIGASSEVMLSLGHLGVDSTLYLNPGSITVGSAVILPQQSVPEPSYIPAVLAVLIVTASVRVFQDCASKIDSLQVRSGKSSAT